MFESGAERIEVLADRGPLKRTALYAAIKAGDLVARKYGRSTLILRSDWEAFLNNQPVAERRGRAPQPNAA